MQLSTILLPDDLIWQDEFSWSAPVQQVSYTVTGALLLQRGIRQAGRPITLAGSETSGWVSRAVLDSLYVIVNAPPSGSMTLILPDARQFQVVFRYHETPIEAHPIVDYNASVPGDWYWIVLRLMVV